MMQLARRQTCFMVTDATGITAEFKIAKTTAGNDALEEAATGLRSDFSALA
jgi:hypothetical protein